MQTRRAVESGIPLLGEDQPRKIARLSTATCVEENAQTAPGKPETTELSFPSQLLSHSSALLRNALKTATREDVFSVAGDNEEGIDSRSQSTLSDEAMEACSRRVSPSLNIQSCSVMGRDPNFCVLFSVFNIKL